MILMEVSITMEKKVLSLIGAITAFVGVAVAAYFIVQKFIQKSGCCCEEVEFDNYVECPCDSDNDVLDDATTPEAEDEQPAEQSDDNSEF